MNYLGAIFVPLAVAGQRKADIKVPLEPIEKWEFYNRVSTVDHILTVQTGDTQRYANILLTVGVRMF